MARNYLCCGVVEVGGVHNGDGMVCGRDAKLPASIAELHFACPHAERCELCSEMFCRPCLSFHQAEHPKPAQSDQVADPQKMKTA